MTDTPKFAVLPMWAMENIRDELRLRPGTWPAIEKAVECADAPDLLPCDVKVAPATVFLKGTPVHTLLMALEKRHRIPVPVATFPAHDGGHIAGWLDAKRNDFLSVKAKEQTERMAITEPGAFDRFTQPLVSLEAYDAVRSRLELTELARGGDAIEIEGLKALNDQLRAELAELKATCKPGGSEQ